MTIRARLKRLSDRLVADKLAWYRRQYDHVVPVADWEHFVTPNGGWIAWNDRREGKP